MVDHIQRAYLASRWRWLYATGVSISRTMNVMTLLTRVELTLRHLDHEVTVFERYSYDQNSYDANDDEIQAASVDHNKIVSP